MSNRFWLRFSASIRGPLVFAGVFALMALWAMAPSLLRDGVHPEVALSAPLPASEPAGPHSYRSANGPLDQSDPPTDTPTNTPTPTDTFTDTPTPQGEVLTSTPTPTPRPWVDGDVFLGLSNGHYRVYDNDGVYKNEDLFDGMPSINYAAGCDFAPSGDLYTANFGRNLLSVFDGHTHAFVTPTIATGIAPESIVFDSDGNFYVGHAVGGGDHLRKYNPARTPTTYPNEGGSDWIDLNSNGTIIYYTGELRSIKRFQVSEEPTQLPDFVTTLPGNGAAYALKIIPQAPWTGQVLVADAYNIKRLNTSPTPTVVATYDVPGMDGWFALNLDPNGTSFWSGTNGSGMFVRFDIASGNVEMTPVAAGHGIGGLCVKGELVAGRPTNTPTNTPTDTPTRTPTNTPTRTPTPTCMVPTPTAYPWACSTRPTATASPTAPLSAKSYYVAPTNTRDPRFTATSTPVGWHGWWWEKGYEDADKRASNGGPSFSVAVLDFGAPYFLPDPSDPNVRIWGTLYAHSDRPFISIENIKKVAGDYAKGYYKRISQLPPPPPVWPRVIIAVGTNNLWWPDLSIDAVGFYGHGRQWGFMVNDLNLTYKDYYPYVEFEGASDIEFEFGDADRALNWAHGFEEVTRYPIGYPAERHYYDYGSCDDCYDGILVTDPDDTILKSLHPVPRGTPGTPTPTPMTMVWTADQAVGVVSANRAALQLPEIYYYHDSPPDQPTQWKWLDMYAATHYICLDNYGISRGIPGKMKVQGAMTSPANLRSSLAWQLLWGALDSSACTTTQFMDRVTPIEYYPND